MPFDFNRFSESPLTQVGLGLLSQPWDAPIGAGITQGLLMNEKLQNAKAERENTRQLRDYQKGMLGMQQQSFGLEQQKSQMELEKMKRQELWAQKMGQGDYKGALAIDPAATAKVLKDSQVKATWQDAGNKLVQIDENGNPTGQEMPKGQLPSQAQPRQPTEFEQYQKNPAEFSKFKQAAKGESADADGLGPLTQSAVDTAATRYLIDGTLPPMGMGKQAAAGRSAILNRAAELGEQSGQTPEEQRQFQIGTSVNKTAMGQLAKQKTMVGAFEKNFVKNADLALNLSNEFDRAGVPLANKWINAGKRAVSGDPELSKLDIAVKATVNEYAKIISGSMGNTAMAEGEIKKVESLLNAAQTPDQVQEVINFMKLETKNRMAGFEEQESELRAGMKLPGGETPPSNPPSLGTVPAHSSGIKFLGFE